MKFLGTYIVIVVAYKRFGEHKPKFGNKNGQRGCIFLGSEVIYFEFGGINFSFGSINGLPGSIYGTRGLINSEKGSNNLFKNVEMRLNAFPQINSIINGYINSFRRSIYELLGHINLLKDAMHINPIFISNLLLASSL